MQLSIAVIAKDEERHIGACLASAIGLADEIVVLLDSRSSDNTDTICRQYGARVVSLLWRGYSAQRNNALSLCQSKWVLFLDADERITDELRSEIHTIITPPPHTHANCAQSIPTSHIDGYWIPRYNIFFSQRLRGGGWYPDYQLRLLRRTHAHYDERCLVHESAELAGETRYLQHHLLHYNIESFTEFWHKQTLYALAEARTLYYNGKHTRWRNYLGAPAREFVRRYNTLGGWRDGTLGLFLCTSLAWFEVVKYGFLKVLQKT